MISNDPKAAVPDRVRLGTTALRVSPLGLGAWAWGDRFYWGFGRKGYGESEIEEAYRVSRACGINFIDTAEVYGMGRSEKFVAEFIGAETGLPPEDRPLVATKFFPYPWRLLNGSLKTALRGSLGRLRQSPIDLYQIHWPYRPRAIQVWVSALAEVHQAGLTRAVGVSNFNRQQTIESHQQLADLGVPLASNQVEFHLLNQTVETSGLLDLCRELGISVIAYSPLASGVLTGKYGPTRPPEGPRARRYTPEVLARMAPLLDLMEDIGQGHGGKTRAQVALNWLLSQGVIPIPGAKTGAQAQENAGALGWKLSPNEVGALRQAGLHASGLT